MNQYDNMVFHIFDLNTNTVTVTQDCNDYFNSEKKDKVYAVNLKNKLIASEQNGVFETINSELFYLLLAAFPEINYEQCSCL